MRSKGTIFDRLAKVSLVPFGSQKSFGPGKDKHMVTHSKLRSGFSGTIVSAEAKTRGKEAILGTPHEPTSPKVSCMGKIKQTNEKNSKQTRCNIRDQEPEPSSSRKKANYQLPGFFGRRRKVQSSSETRATKFAAQPRLGQVKKLSSRRNALADFDWRSMTDDDEPSVDYAPEGGDHGAKVELQPKEEVNLWKRRPMAQLPQLQLKKREDMGLNQIC